MLQISAPTEAQKAAWHAKHDLSLDDTEHFEKLPDGNMAVTDDQLTSNIKANLARKDIPNLEPSLFTKATMVFVCGGPSAMDSLDEIRAKSLDSKYDVYCSNATAKWLLDNGITPKYQVIIDPQPSKVNDVAHGADIDYLIGVQCDPSLFDALEGKRIQKFLAASKNEEFKIARESLSNESLVSIGGGSMMGTRALTLANALGYRRLEYYGFDGCVRVADNRVQNYAYDKLRTEAITSIECEDGRQFFSTITFSRQAHELVAFIDRMPWLNVVIHGDGFLSHVLALHRVKAKPIAINRISDGYLAMQKTLHENPKYGVNLSKLAAPIYLLSSQMSKKLGKCDVLDYGCGKSALTNAIESHFAKAEGVRLFGYDPAVPGKDAEPLPVDLVVCADVMEHVEIDCVDAVLDHIAILAKHCVYFSICMVPAAKTLPDGRNAHITLLDEETWVGKLKCRWVITECQVRGAHLVAIGQPIPRE
jgi:hypothetical protein